MLSEISIALAFLLPLFYYLWTKNYNYWESQGVPSLGATFPFGTIKDLIFIRTNLIRFLNHAYKKYPNSKIIGFYAFRQPMLILRDLGVIKDVLVKDFNSFADNGFVTYASVDPMLGLNSFSIQGPEWKVNRGIQSPAHTVSKIKLMIPNMIKSAESFAKYLSQQNNEVCVNELARFYTTDAVAACAFGAHSDCFFDKESQFIKNTLGQLFNQTNSGVLSAFFAPWVTLVFRIRVVQKIAEDFFLHLGKVLVEQRRESNATGNDLVQHLISVQDKAVKEGKPILRPIDIAAQLMTFFLDGSETASLALSTTLFEIAANEDVQERLRDEIKSVGNSPQDFDYEKLWSIEYLEMVLCECLRIHAPIPLLSRLCTEDYNLNGVKIEKGTKVFIPVHSIHHDPDIYPDPDKFDPERFSKDNKSGRSSYSFMPFGEGPRICVGFRFAQTEIKMAIVVLLLKFKLILSSKRHPTKRFQLDESSSFVYTSKEDLYIKFDPLK